MLSVLLSSSTPSPEISATEDPTERSIIPAEITRLIPMAQMPVIAPCTNWLVRFVKDKKDGLITTAMSIRKTKLSQWL